MSTTSLRFFRLTCFCIAALSSFALAAAQKDADQPGPGTTLPSTKTLPANYPVITVKKTCPSAATKQPASTPNCTSVVTRAEFEELVHAINARMITRDRVDLAENYGKMLALSDLALSKGLDKNRGTAALVRYARTGALGGAGYKYLLRETSEISNADIEKYYDANKRLFERFNFQRVYIPLEPRPEPVPLQDVDKADNKPPSGPDMKQVADKIRERAAAGETFVELQKSVVQTAGLNGDPNVDLTDMLVGSLPAEHDKVFELAPNSVSPVIKDASGYYVYKLISRHNPPLNEIRPQVLLRLQNDKMAAALKKVEENSSVNKQYFEKYEPPPPDPNEPEVEDD